MTTLQSENFLNEVPSKDLKPVQKEETNSSENEKNNTQNQNGLDGDVSIEEQRKKYEEGKAQVKIFGNELKELFYKSQDSFEKQLSYISAGALALSVGFIKDIVHPIKESNYKWLLISGWALLIFTLLLNLVSHMLAGKYAKMGAKETEDIENTYNPEKINNRAKRMDRINWTTVGLLAGGIILIVIYITFNAIL